MATFLRLSTQIWRFWNEHRMGRFCRWITRENSRHSVTPPPVLPAKWRLRNEGRNSILMTRHYPNLGSVASSVWNFCTRYFAGNYRWRHGMLAVSSGLQVKRSSVFLQSTMIWMPRQWRCLHNSEKSAMLPLVLEHFFNETSSVWERWNSSWRPKGMVGFLYSYGFWNWASC